MRVSKRRKKKNTEIMYWGLEKHLWYLFLMCWWYLGSIFGCCNGGVGYLKSDK